MTEEPRENAKILKNSYHKSSKTSESGESIAQRVYSLLDKSPYSTPKSICSQLKLSYETHGNYISVLKSRRKSYHQFELGSKCSNLHNARAFCYVPKSADRDRALEVGWIQSKSRNRFLVFKDSEFGRVVWFETGRVNVMIKKPQQMGRVKKLLCKAFYESGLIYDLKVLDAFLASVHWKGAHYVHECSERLPYKVIDNYVESHGIRIILGDGSHPNAVEVQWCCPDWLEKLELKLDLNSRILEIGHNIILENTKALMRFNHHIEGWSRSNTLTPSPEKSFIV